ncbi:hypothetical protein B0T20DRAFT_389305 [Sordaria brevicollis]|uniref:C2H2-type domain-containing protein n=1 Tax=Sordaria brevicollis TaxID=83679 RepID=A0AAE0UEK0_SORBR|nr:hypothetical protein B0T20DRAFT_389305 [Sordaria brevicollis]
MSTRACDSPATWSFNWLCSRIDSASPSIGSTIVGGRLDAVEGKYHSDHTTFSQICKPQNIPKLHQHHQAPTNPMTHEAARSEYRNLGTGLTGTYGTNLYPSRTSEGYFHLPQASDGTAPHEHGPYYLSGVGAGLNSAQLRAGGNLSLDETHLSLTGNQAIPGPTIEEGPRHGRHPISAAQTNPYATGLTIDPRVLQLNNEEPYLGGGEHSPRACWAGQYLQNIAPRLPPTTSTTTHVSATSAFPTARVQGHLLTDGGRYDGATHGFSYNPGQSASTFRNDVNIHGLFDFQSGDALELDHYPPYQPNVPFDSGSFIPNRRHIYPSESQRVANSPAAMAPWNQNTTNQLQRPFPTGVITPTGSVQRQQYAPMDYPGVYTPSQTNGSLPEQVSIAPNGISGNTRGGFTPSVTSATSSLAQPRPQQAIRNASAASIQPGTQLTPMFINSDQIPPQQARLRRVHCPICNHKSMTRRDMQRHIDDKHDDRPGDLVNSGWSLTTRLPCPYRPNGCKATFHRPDRQSRHVRTVHRGQQLPLESQMGD